MKKALAIVLALVMVMSLSLTALAVTNNDSGTITVNNAVNGETYTAYQILVLDSYSGTAHAYSVAAEWEDFVKGAGAAWLTYDEENNMVTWTDEDADDIATMQAFADAALAYAKDKGIDGEEVTAANGKAEFTGLNLGYYLISSTVGTVNTLMLDTTNMDAVVSEKNPEPTLGKEVQEDDDASWGAANDAAIDEIVNFKLTAQVVGFADNYVIHDTMGTGLSFNADSVVITLDGATLVAGTDYNVVTTGLTDGDTFEIVFTDAFEAKVNAASTDGDAVETVIVTYNATVTDAAAAEVAIPNTANLSFVDYEGNPDETEEVTTNTFTWAFDVLKYANGVETDVLNGVEFELYFDEALTQKVTFTVDNGAYEYDAQGTVTTLVTADGKIRVQGLDCGTYYLKETKTNDGFNLLKEAVVVEIADQAGADTIDLVVNDEKVNNNSGIELPETGGIGTVLFILIGSLLVMATGVVLVTNKRMSKIAD